MNAPQSLKQLTSPHPVRADSADVGGSLVEWWHILVDGRWTVGIITGMVLALGTAYALLSSPIYEANLLLQVEDSSGSAKSLLGDAGSLFDVKTPATAEIEILRSRMVIGEAVDQTKLYIEAHPRYLPLIGAWMARHASGLSNPGFFGFGSWVHGTERIEVEKFDLPEDVGSSSFVLTALGGGRYSLSNSDFDSEIHGSVGQTLFAHTRKGQLALLVTTLVGKPGAQFIIERRSRLKTVQSLQQSVRLMEKGRQSGIIEASLQDADRDRLTSILNAIGTAYVRQNVDRKAAEAEKTLAFLNVQLPQLKRQLEQSEDAYNRYRNQYGTVALDEQTKLLLDQSVDLQSRLADSQQKRLELVSRFTAEHPAIKTLDSQIAEWKRQISSLDAKIKALPSLQQEAIRLQRDVQVNSDLYGQLRSSALQLQVVREGKVGNVRVIDRAVAPEKPIKPNRPLTVALSAIVGFLLSILTVAMRNVLTRGIRSAHEIETNAGLSVYSTIPLSDGQVAMARKVAARHPGLHILAHSAPHDLAIESLRSLRTAVQFAMLNAENNRVLITGPSPGVGKSFVSANFAAVLASAGKRVLLIDADLRKGHLNQYFGVERSAGLSEVIAGTLTTESAIRADLLPNLDFLPTGVLPPNPAELLISRSFEAVLEKLSPTYDLVIVDSAPVLVAADTLSVSLHTSTVLLVARADQSLLGELNESARRLAHTGVSVSGVLLNAVDLTRRHYGREGYGYGTYQYRQYSYEPTPTAST